MFNSGNYDTNCACNLATDFAPIQSKPQACPCQKCRGNGGEVDFAAKTAAAITNRLSGITKTFMKWRNSGENGGSGSCDCVDNTGASRNCENDPTCFCVASPNSSKNFTCFMMETVSVVAFFIIAIIIFWVSVGYHLGQLVWRLCKAQRSCQLIALVVIGALFLAMPATAPRTSCRSLRRIDQANCGITSIHTDTNQNNQKPAEKLIDAKLNAKPLLLQSPLDSAADMQSKHPAVLLKEFNEHILDTSTAEAKQAKLQISDEQGREIFQRARLYAIPSEMKQSPLIINQLRNLLMGSA